MKSRLHRDWAEIVDLFASEYGWSVSTICKLDYNQIELLIKAMNARYERQNPKEKEETEDTFTKGLEKIGRREIREDGTEVLIV